ncbi:MAG: hypothetical protein FD123_3285 [Bacteroidetes bacterium]|nr:MAG: hypothetical protein FD123_3285 [Bacteroidota bacterium]
MKQYLFLFAVLLSDAVSAQRFLPVQTCVSVPGDSTELLLKNKVQTCTETQVDKKTGRFISVAIKYYNEKGCLVRTIYSNPDNRAGGKYDSETFTYGDHGIVILHQRLWYDKDSNEVVYHKESFSTDKKGRYTEAHYNYNNKSQVNPNALVAEDFYYSYDQPGYGLIVKHFKRSEKDTLNADTYYYTDVNSVKAEKAVMRQYLPNGKINERVQNEMGHTVSSTLYSDRTCKAKDVHYQYVYEYKNRLMVHEKSLREVNGKMELERETFRNGNEITYVIYKNGKEAKRETEILPVADKEENPDDGENPLPAGGCITRKQESKDAKGNKIITEWQECPGSSTPSGLFKTSYQKNGLPVKIEYEGDYPDVIITYTYRAGKK